MGWYGNTVVNWTSDNGYTYGRNVHIYNEGQPGQITEQPHIGLYGTIREWYGDDGAFVGYWYDFCIKTKKYAFFKAKIYIYICGQYVYSFDGRDISELNGTIDADWTSPSFSGYVSEDGYKRGINHIAIWCEFGKPDFKGTDLYCNAMVYYDDYNYLGDGAAEDKKHNRFYLPAMSWYTAPKDLSFTITKITGTTIKVKPTWTNGSKENTASVTCNGVTKTTKSSGTELEFTGLANNTTYTISCSSSDGTTNLSTSDQNATTYGVICDSTDRSTRAISGIFRSNRENRALQYYVTNASGGIIKGTTDLSSGGNAYADGITHGSIYYIRCWIADISDAVTTVRVDTKTLTLVNTGITPYQFSISSTWQAKADGENYNTNISFVNSQCGCGSGRVTYCTYGTINIDSLISYTNYTVTAVVTDGVNTASAAAATKTLFPYVRVFYNGAWRKAMPYIWDGSRWRLAKTYVYNSGWKETNTN